MTLNVTAVTVMTMRSCGGPKRTDMNGFVDFFDEFKDTNCMLAVYSGKKMLHSAVYNESNRSSNCSELIDLNIWYFLLYK